MTCTILFAIASQDAFRLPSFHTAIYLFIFNPRFQEISNISHAHTISFPFFWASQAGRTAVLSRNLAARNYSTATTTTEEAAPAAAVATPAAEAVEKPKVEEPKPATPKVEKKGLSPSDHGIHGM
jgi:hypothetical protein